jgi:myo-inositol-1(or 4)-monophosphatase
MDMEYNVALDGRHADVNQALKECGVVFTPRSAGYCFEARVAAFDELSRSLDLLRREGRKSLRMAKAREVILNDGEGVPDRWVLLSDCLAATEIAARRAQDCRRRGLEILYKADGSPVTDADICAEEAIRGFLKARQHRFRFHGEDSDVHEDDQGPWEVVVDGIDGTRNFRDGNYGWCVTIACRQRETTECAIIFDPVSRTTYYAVCGEGAYIRDDDGVRRCTTPSTIPADFSFSLGSFQVSKRNDWKEHVRGRIKAIGGREREWGSVALAICAVARGGLGVFIQIGAHLHDIIAASAVAQEAGASVWLQNSLTTGRGDIIVAHRSLIDAAKAALYATVE